MANVQDDYRDRNHGAEDDEIEPLSPDWWPRVEHRQCLVTLPEELRHLAERKIWMGWRWQLYKWKNVAPKDEDPDWVRVKLSKWIKVPRQCGNADKNGDVSDHHTWDTHAEAVWGYERGRYHGIGFVVIGEDPAVIDLDKAVERERVGNVAKPISLDCIDPWAWKIITEVKHDAYIELSPSLTGVRVIGRGEGGEISAQRKDLNPDREGAAYEAYRKTLRFITYTGWSFERNPRRLGYAINRLIERLAREADEVRARKAEQAKAAKPKAPARERPARLTKELLALLPERYRAMVEKGAYDRAEYQSGSEAGCALITYAYGRKFTHAEIRSLLEITRLHDYDSASTKRLDDEIERVIGKFGGSTTKSAEPHGSFKANRFVHRPTKDIERDCFLYGKHYVRQYVTGTAGGGGIGKSGLLLHEAIAMVLGEPILGVEPDEPDLRVMYWNGEDPLVRIEKRVHAAIECWSLNKDDIRRHYNLDSFGSHDLLTRKLFDRIEGRLFINSGRIDRIKLAHITKGTVKFNEAIFDDLIATIKENHIDVAIFDPVVLAHAVGESSNDNMALVVERFGQIAVACNCSVELCFEVRKPGPNNTMITMDDVRGASVQSYRVRSGRIVRPMKEDEAKQLNLSDPRFFFSLSRVKYNLTEPPVEKRTWLRNVNIPLANGDQVGALLPLKLTEPAGILSNAQRRAIMVKASTGKWRESQQSPDWIGRAVAEVVGLRISGGAAVTSQVKVIIEDLIVEGVLETVKRKDKGERKAFTYVVPGTWKAPVEEADEDD